MIKHKGILIAGREELEELVQQYGAWFEASKIIDETRGIFRSALNRCYSKVGDIMARNDYDFCVVGESTVSGATATLKVDFYTYNRSSVDFKRHIGSPSP